MSAFVVSPDHCFALASFAASKSPGHGEPRVRVKYIKGLEHLDGTEGKALAYALADVLYRENVRSVAYRYGRDDLRPDLDGVLMGRSDLFPRDGVSILKMLDGLEYQSCETPDWEQSVAYALSEAIRRAAIRTLPGYEDAPWVWDRDWRRE